MKINYWLEKKEFEQNRASIGTNRVIEMSVMDREDKIWRKSKVEISDQPIKGSQPVALMGPFGEIGDEGIYHIKLIEVLPQSEEDL